MIEVEAKFAADSRALERVGALESIAGLVVRPTGIRRFDNVYLDTPAGDLGRAEAGFRVRRGNGRLEITLKLRGVSEGGIHERPEWNLEADDVPRTLADVPPGTLHDRLAPLCTVPGFEVVVETRLERDRRLLISGAREVAELLLDRVEVLDGEDRMRFCEVEVELLEEGTREDLEGVSRALADLGLVRSAESKLERALAWVRRRR